MIYFSYYSRIMSNPSPPPLNTAFLLITPILTCSSEFFWRFLISPRLYLNWNSGIYESFTLLIICIKLSIEFPSNFSFYKMGVWKSRKPESGIGTGMGTGTETGTGTRNGTGRVMWRGTDTRIGTSFTLNYFNSNLIYAEHKKTSLVSRCLPKLFILPQRGVRISSKLDK